MRVGEIVEGDGAMRGVQHVIVSSSGAAYGYHPDNPAWLSETDAIRGNHEFAYSWHKRLVEEMLAEYREREPQLRQTVFRIGTILGETVSNQITALFDMRLREQQARLEKLGGEKRDIAFGSQIRSYVLLFF